MNVTDSFFQQKPDIKPIIYAYELVGVESHKGYIKVGETTRSAAERIREQTHTVAVQFRVLGTWSALRDDGTLDWRYVEGEVRFRDNCLSNLLKTRPEFAQRAIDQTSIAASLAERAELDAMITRMKRKGHARARFVHGVSFVFVIQPVSVHNKKTDGSRIHFFHTLQELLSFNFACGKRPRASFVFPIYYTPKGKRIKAKSRPF